MGRFPFWVLGRKIKYYWQRKRIVRGATAVAVLTAAVIFQYYLANRPLPIDVTSPGNKYTPATARLKQEELVIENPNLDSGRALFLLRGKMGEFVNIHFDKARLSEETFALFKDESDPPPAVPVTIDLITEEARKPKNAGSGTETVVESREGDNKRTCIISINANVAPDSKLPTKIHLYQAKGSESGRDFYMVVDADLVVEMQTSPPIDKPHHVDSFAPGCGKFLNVGGWGWHHAGLWEIKVIAAANSVLHFTFLQDRPGSFWKGSGDPFQPFTFEPQPLQAQRVSVNPLSGDKPSTASSPPNLSASARDGALIINNLMVSAEELQLDYSGTALVQIHGEYVTGSLLDHLKKYPLIAGLFALVNAALLGWFIRIFKGIISGRSKSV